MKDYPLQSLLYKNLLKHLDPVITQPVTLGPNSRLGHNVLVTDHKEC